MVSGCHPHYVLSLLITPVHHSLGSELPPYFTEFLANVICFGFLVCKWLFDMLHFKSTDKVFFGLLGCEWLASHSLFQTF